LALKAATGIPGFTIAMHKNNKHSFSGKEEKCKPVDAPSQFELAIPVSVL
jgi:hypothetical protein